MAQMTQTQLNLPLPKTTKSWQGYSTATKTDSARAKFEEKYGRPPSEILRNGGALLLGPLTEAEARRQ